MESSFKISQEYDSLPMPYEIDERRSIDVQNFDGADDIYKNYISSNALELE